MFGTRRTNVWPTVQTAIRKVHDLKYEIDQIYEEKFPAIIPNYKVGPIQEPHQLNKSPNSFWEKEIYYRYLRIRYTSF